MLAKLGALPDANHPLLAVAILLETLLAHPYFSSIIREIL